MSEVTDNGNGAVSENGDAPTEGKRARPHSMFKPISAAERRQKSNAFVKEFCRPLCATVVLQEILPAGLTYEVKSPTPGHLYSASVTCSSGPVFHGQGATEAEAKNKAAEKMIHALYVWGVQGGVGKVWEGMDPMPWVAITSLAIYKMLDEWKSKGPIPDHLQQLAREGEKPQETDLDPEEKDLQSSVFSGFFNGQSYAAAPVPVAVPVYPNPLLDPVEPQPSAMDFTDDDASMITFQDALQDPLLEKSVVARGRGERGLRHMPYRRGGRDGPPPFPVPPYAMLRAPGSLPLAPFPVAKNPVLLVNELLGRVIYNCTEHQSYTRRIYTISAEVKGTKFSGTGRGKKDAKRMCAMKILAQFYNYNIHC